MRYSWCWLLNTTTPGTIYLSLMSKIDVPYGDLRKVNLPFEAECRQSFDTLRQSVWCIFAQDVQKIEELFASYCRAKHFVCVADELYALILH